MDISPAYDVRPRKYDGQLEPDEKFAWDMYFSGLIAFQLHPGNKIHPANIDLVPYAFLADRMIEERRKR